MASVPAVGQERTTLLCEPRHAPDNAHNLAAIRPAFIEEDTNDSKLQMTPPGTRAKVACRVKRSFQHKDPAGAKRWARSLSRRVERILQSHPDADPDNVRHTLILLQKPPLERLQRSLIRARATAIFRK
ncbi:MAG: hypothetical protein C5B50_01655 [Verrucomicrobia bacterium]|nr:MAG: hypothetical protein C5B50_01655 [Verrucomicrobiota bacterium]